jgi:hypothetical protein
MTFTRLPHYFVLILAGFLLLAACGPATEPAAAPPVLTSTPAPAAEEAEPDTVGETAVATSTQPDLSQPPPLVIDETAVITGDDRSNTLARLTSNWRTNWERRTISTDEVMSGGPPRDGIPPIDNPQFISPDEASEWLADNEPVVIFTHDEDARAYPLQILTWHEIVNDEVGGLPVSVTFCPLCNATVVFDRRLGDEVYDFGVSGLLRNSDLIMWDRQTESLWQQFTGEGIVGDLAGAHLQMLPSAIVSFADFRITHPDGLVLSRETGHNRRYGQNPYVGYDTIGQNPFLFRGVVDGRLPAMVRVITVSFDELDIAYPLPTLAEMGVINDEQAGQPIAVFHAPGTSSALGAAVIAEAEDVGATGVFDPVLDGQHLTFRAENGRFIDDQTNTTWNILGQAVDGPLVGSQLERLVHADHFWFSWAAFKPDTIIYSP